jgi:hypothetical protein
MRWCIPVRNRSTAVANLEAAFAITHLCAGTCLYFPLHVGANVGPSITPGLHCCSSPSWARLPGCTLFHCHMRTPLYNVHQRLRVPTREVFPGPLTPCMQCCGKGEASWCKLVHEVRMCVFSSNSVHLALLLLGPSLSARLGRNYTCACHQEIAACVRASRARASAACLHRTIPGVRDGDRYAS